MNDLVLTLRHEYFDAIKSGVKTEEYRETTDYWKRRLIGKTFNNIVLFRGWYSSKRTPENCLVFPWRGYTIKRIPSWERQETVKVFAMPLIGGSP